jgi:hypothetical protein
MENSEREARRLLDRVTLALLIASSSALCVYLALL